MFKTKTELSFIDDQLTSAIRRNILTLLIESGFQIAPDALQYLLELESPLDIVENIILVKNPANSPSVLSKDYIESLSEGRDTFSPPPEPAREDQDEQPEQLPESEPEP